MYNFHGIYRYSPRFATNWRAVAALVIGFAPPLAGFINSVSLGEISVSDGGKNLYVLSFFIFVLNHAYHYSRSSICIKH